MVGGRGSDSTTCLGKSGTVSGSTWCELRLEAEQPVPVGEDDKKGRKCTKIWRHERAWAKWDVARVQSLGNIKYGEKRREEGAGLGTEKRPKAVQESLHATLRSCRFHPHR